jgi:hypothetical protein
VEASLRRTSAHRPLAVVAALALAGGLAACGGGGPVRDGGAPAPVASQASAVAPPLRAPTDPSAVVAQVGPSQITGATIARFMAAEQSSWSASERLVAPDFNACVAHLRSESAARGESPPAASQLRSECQTRYLGLVESSLERLIAEEWVIGAARELGLPINEQAALPTRVKLASAAIRRAVMGRVRTVTQTQIASYYAHHRYQYLASAQRDVEIARAFTGPSVAKARTEIAAGKSFASVVARLTQEGVHPTAFTLEGLGMEVRPHEWGEPNLMEAIYAAKPGVLSEPVNTWYGWFVFRVTRIRFEHETPLADVQASIRRQLQDPPQERALAAFIKQWRSTWRARTVCSPGDVVAECRQSKGSLAAAPEGPPTLD